MNRGRCINSFLTAFYLLLMLIGCFFCSRILLWGGYRKGWNEDRTLILIVGINLGVFVFSILAWRMARKKLLIRMFLLTGLIITILFSLVLFKKHVYVGYFHQFPAVEEISSPGFTITLGDGRGLDDEQLGEHLKSFPLIKREMLLPIIGIDEDESKLIKEAEELLRSEYRFFNYESVQLPDNLSWDESPYDDRSCSFELHNMDYVVTLTQAYEETGDVIYLKRAEYLILDWISDNTRCIFGYPSEFSWGDHSTSIRLRNWLYFFNTWRVLDIAESKEVAIVFRSMLGHASLLSFDWFYTFRHNHGIDQDKALLAFSVIHPYVKQSSYWKNLALNRLSKQIDFAISSSGVHLEHSSGYHLFGLNQLQTILDFITLWNIEHKVADKINGKVSEMISYLPYIVKPDGFIVQIGDTKHISITNELNKYGVNFPPNKRFYDTADYSSSNCVATAFVDEGYAIIRDFFKNWECFKESFYLFFAAGAHEGRGHRQSDDLSFVLSYSGQEMLIDPGYYSYNSNKKRRYVVSVQAHNTVVVDNESYNGYDTSLDFFTANDRYVVLRASHRNYPKIEHTRWVIYLRPNMLFVIDRLDSGKDSGHGESHHFDQLFHFSPELKLNISNDQKECTVHHEKNGNCLLILTQLGKVKPTMRIAEGEQSPMQGWYSPAQNVLVPSPTLVSSVDGESASYITVIEIDNMSSDLKSLDLKRSDFQASVINNEILIEWIESEKSCSIKLNTKDCSFVENLPVEGVSNSNRNAINELK